MTVLPDLRTSLVRAAASHVSASEREPVAPGAAHGGRGRRRSLRRGIGGGLAVVILAGGLATATGLVVPQRTKDRSTELTRAAAPSGTNPGRFATLGDEMVALAADVQAGLPYPPGMRDGYDWSKYSAGATLGTGGETRREIQIMSESRAGCLWRRYLVERHDARDEAGVADAIAVLEQSDRWPGTRSLGDGINGVFVAAARRGDYAFIRRDLAINCADATLGASPAEVAAAKRRGSPLRHR